MSPPAGEAGAPLAYVNLVGGQDELVFDGDSLVVDAEGDVLARAPQFADRASSDCSTFGPDQPQPHVESPPRLSDEAEVYQAACRAVFATTCARTASAASCSALSGGIDSALAAAIAVDALGADAVFGVSMPSAYSSQHSRDDAADLAADRAALP